MRRHDDESPVISRPGSEQGDPPAAGPTLYERSVAGRCGTHLPDPDVPRTDLPAELLREENGLPELSELDVVRHYQGLAQASFGVDSGFYPLGSCTMKYNPRIDEDIARFPEFLNSHPLQPLHTVQGNLALLYELQNALAEIGGFDAVSLQPAAGAHGELTALLMMRAFHADRGEAERSRVLIPDTAHGTNPASTTMAGFDVLEIPSDENGNVDLRALDVACDQSVVGIMLTNPNTLGLFDENLEQIIALVHGCGGLVYGDGANMNALAGMLRPADFGIDLMHYNLHKTFGTPHGGGGPGAGPIGASPALAAYLPGPLIGVSEHQNDERSIYKPVMPAKSIGRMTPWWGNFGVFVRAYAYLRLHGLDGLRANAMHSVLNANYLRVMLRDDFPVPFDRMVMHEFVCRGEIQGSPVRAVDICKRLMDFGFHPPTSNFPLVVREALMIEPTETESKSTLDAFIAAMRTIATEAVDDPSQLFSAPHATPVGRLDEVGAARHPVLQEPASDRPVQE